MAIERYGLKWPEKYNELHVELAAFRDGTKKFGGDDDNRPYHFKRIVSHYWGRGSKKQFVWNPWTDRMLEAACKYNYPMYCGSASSGKTFFLAVWGIVNWLCDPLNTLVLYTSTSLEDSRRRIWGDVEGFLMAAKDEKAGKIVPAKILSSTGKVRTHDAGVTHPDKCGLQLIPGDRAKEKENIGKIIGAKNNRVFLVADELPELSPALVEAAKSNLMTNPYFQMLGSGNFKSIYDPFGQLCEPVGGWGQVTPDYEEWPTKDGLCLRFDGHKSPNIIEGFDKYPGIYGMTQLKNHKSLGENTAIYWRMCRSFPCPEADADRIYSEADLTKGDVLNSVVRWKEAPKKLSGLDPAFATGGDRAIAVVAELGESIENKKVLRFTKFVELKEDIRKKDQNRALQVAKKYIELCQSENVLPENAAYDGSGGGIVFGSLLSELWSPKPLGVQFGGAASERPASIKDRRPAREAFNNRVAEIWYAGVDYIQSGQIKGLTQEVCSELTERRKLESLKGSSGVKIRIERKQDMKARTGGKSCDLADAALILLELARTKLNFQPVGMEGKRALVNRDKRSRISAIERLYRGNTHEHSYADSEAA